MDENKFRAIVEDVVNKAVEPIKEQLSGVTKRLDDPEIGLVAINRRLDDPEIGLVAINKRLDDSETGLAAINRRLDANTAAVMELEETVNGYGDMYKINDSNIRKMEKRLETIEEKEGLEVPLEFQLAEISG